MSYIRVKPNGMDAAADELSSISVSLNTYIGSLRIEQANRTISASGSGEIYRALGNVISYLDSDRDGIRSLSEALAQTGATYSKAETEVSDLFGSKPSFDWDFPGLINDIVGEFGIIGEIGSWINELVTGDGDLLTGAKAVKGLVGWSGDLLSWAFSEESDLGTLFGFAMPDKVPGSFSDAIAAQVDKYIWPKGSMGKAVPISDKIDVVCKWAGAGMTVVTTGIENFTDPENSPERAFLETIGESAVKIGEGMLLSSLLAMTGAPVVVAGIGVVAATWAIDKGFELVTGKNAAEFISDTAIDFVGNVADTISQGAEMIGNAVSDAVGNAVSTVGEAVSGWWNNLGFSF